MDRILQSCWLIAVFSILIDKSSAAAADARINSITPHSGSLNGGTKITIIGSNFAESQFTFGPESSHLGNKVRLVSTTRSYTCEIFPNGNTPVQIECFTVAMVDDHYYVRVEVDGEPVPVNRHCNSETSYHCRFHPNAGATPTLYDIVPSSGEPGTVIKYVGKLMTSRVFSTEEASTNGREERIRRVYVGSETCELRMNPFTDDLYQVMLYNNGASNQGQLRCRHDGRYIGNVNASVLIEGQYGRTQPQPETYRVSKLDKIYMFQTYPVITDISPAIGGLEGGTKITLTGKYFDSYAPSEQLQVNVAGLPCTDVNIVSETEATCYTPMEPAEESDFYPGNRGLTFHLWNGTSGVYRHMPQIEEILDYDREASNYWQFWSDGAGFFEDEFVPVIEGTDMVVKDFTRYMDFAEGYFLPPADGEYTFYLIADDVAQVYFSNQTGHPDDKQVLLNCASYCPHYDTTDNQVSETFTLQAGSPYYLQVLHGDFGGNGHVQLGVKVHKTGLNNAQSDMVVNEKQQIQISSTVTNEIQQLDLSGWPGFSGSGSAVSEVQEVTLAFDDASAGTFTLCVNGAKSAGLALDAEANTIKEALNRLPGLPSDAVTSVTRSGNTLEITFNEDSGNMNALEFEAKPTTAATASVNTTTEGVSNLAAFQLTLDDVISGLIPSDATADDLSSALMNLFSVRCPKDIDGSHPDFDDHVKFHIDFEDPEWTDSAQWGERSMEQLPFCGRGALRNPTTLFDDSADGLTTVFLTLYKKMCFAYMGEFENHLSLRYMYTEDREQETTTDDFEYVFINDDEWHFDCINVLELLSTEHPGATNFKLLSVEVESAENALVDSVMIVRESYTTFVDEGRFEDLYMERVLPPLGGLMEDIMVNETAEGQFEVEFLPVNCLSGLPLLSLHSSQAISGDVDSEFLAVSQDGTSGEASLNVTRLSDASPPVDGTFDVTYHGQTVTVNATASAEAMRDSLQTIVEIGSVSVTRTGDCAGYTYTVEFLTRGGDQDSPTVDGTNLVGNEVEIEAIEHEAGGVLHPIIPGDMIVSIHTQPQVTVSYNGIAAKCATNCSFEWSNAYTPTATAISPSSGSSADTIAITGTNFGTDVNETHVMLGEVECDVTSVEDTEIECTPQVGPVGDANVTVRVDSKGLASQPSGILVFTYTAQISSISPTSAEIGGGMTLTIDGYGFKENSTVTIGSEECEVESLTFTSIECLVPRIDDIANVNDAQQVDVTHEAHVLTSPTDFNYTEGLNIVGNLSLLNSTTTNVWAGTVLLLTPDSTFIAAAPTAGLSASINGETVEILDIGASDIELQLPANPPGTYSLVLSSSSGANVYVEDGALDVEYVFEMTSVSPTNGSYEGGTTLTLTGQGFPTTSDDATPIVTLDAGTACVIETFSDTEIVCVTQSSSVEHRVDNMGIHASRGVGFAWNPANLELEVGDSVRWLWSVADGISGVQFKIQETSSAADTEPMSAGFYSGDESTPQGSFVYQFTSAGDYFYNSGNVLTNGDFVMKGTIRVRERSSSEVKVAVMVDDFEAVYTVGSPASIAPDNCITTVPEDSCDMGDYSNDDLDSSAVFTYVWSTCHTPVVMSVMPRELNVTENITITGVGFTDEPCQHTVLFGEHECDVIASSATEITCQFATESDVPMYTQLPISANVNNRGNALIKIEPMEDKFVTLKPIWDEISVQRGAVTGGTELIITGAGFATEENGMQVYFANTLATIISVSSSTIELSTPAATEGTYEPEVLILINGSPAPVDCLAADCTFEYAQDVTPVINNYTETAINGDNEITITIQLNNSLVSEVSERRKRSISNDDVIVTVGDETCDVTAVTESEITCTLTEPAAGSHDLELQVTSLGYATTEDGAAFEVIVEGSVDSVSPVVGSINGGTVLTINGTGFSDGDTTVNVGGATCVIVAVSYEEITCTTGPMAAAAVDVDVSVGGAIVGGSLSFTYEDASTPTVTAINPTSVTGAATITITGTQFDASQTTISIGDVACTSVTGSSTSLECSFIPAASGTFDMDVLVSNLGYASMDDGVELEVGSELSSLSASTGSFGGGHDLVLSGSGFPATDPDSVMVFLCDVEAEVTDVTSTEIDFTTPANSGSGTQACDVVATVSGTNYTLSSAYTYDDSLTISVTDVSPRRGGTGGGTTLTITVANINGAHSGLTVSIAGVDCAVQSNDGSTVTCTTGASSVTTATHVQVSLGTGQSPTNDDSAFEYIDVWSSQWTWGGQDPPIEGDLVVITEGQTILLDTDTPILKMLVIQGGTLKFDTTRDIHLQAEYILVTNGGSFFVGSEDEPYEQQAVIELHGNLRAEELPIYGAKVLAVRDGFLGLYGKPIPHTWSFLAETASAGSNTVTLELAATGWNVGDIIVLPTTGDRHSQIENEIFEIAAVSGDEMTLTLNGSLEYDHIVVNSEVDGHSISLKGEIGLLSRNIKIKGSNNPSWHVEIEACPEGFDTGEFQTQTCFQGRFGDEIGSDGFGAFIMMHASAPDQNLLTAHIEYIEMNYVGQEFRLGRYPIHFHLNGDMTGSYVRGIGIMNSFNRAVNVHGTHNLVIEHNVIYNIRGGAFFFEDGIETGNTLQYNLAVFVISSTSLLNEDITPAVIWITNPNNTIQHNAAAGGTHFGFWYRMHPHPDGPSFTTSVCPTNVPVGRFYNNTVHSQGWFGLWIFKDYFPKVDGSCNSNAASEQALFENLLVWHCEKGAEWVDVTDLKFDNFWMINNEKAGIEMKMIRNSKRRFLSSGSVVSNSLIVAHLPEDPIYASKCTATGIILPMDSGLLTENVVFINFDRSGCQALGVTSIDGKCVTGCGGYGYHFSGLDFVNSPNKARWRWEHEGALIDLDGSLTGTANMKVVPNVGILPSTCTVADDNTGFNMGSRTSALCPPEVEFVRFAFNHPSPSSLNYKNARFISDSDNSRSMTAPWLAKRLTHKNGWMAMLVADTSYTMEFVDAEHITNISYTGSYYDLQTTNYVVMKSHVDVAPDRIYVRTGDNRDASENPLTYSANNDGDWYYDTVNNKISYIVSGRTSDRKRRSGSEFDELIDSAVQFQAYKCYYPDCIVPDIGGGDQVPATERPNYAVFWSEASSWSSGFLPGNNEDVTIEIGRWVVVDIENLPIINNLYIYGTLEFEFAENEDTSDYYNFLLRVKNIFIARTGRLIAGWEDSPFLGSLDIELRGGNEIDNLLLYPGDEDDGPLLGGKAIAVFGGLDLYGDPEASSPTHTRLASTANAGVTTLELQDPVSWSAGDEVVIAGTGYDAMATEMRTIASVSGDGMTVTLTEALQYTHLGVEHVVPGRDDTYNIRAEVGLLSRNIRIKSPDDEDITLSFGPRVLISTMVNLEGVSTGYARLRNVEFWRTGQEGYVTEYDPRFSLSYLNTGEVNDFRPSYVENCSFVESYSPALGVFGAQGLNVKNNVVYRTVGHAMKIWGTSNLAENNLITLVVWPGSYNGREESVNFDWVAGIEGSEASDLSLINNIVAGSERSGYIVSGDPCSDDVDNQRMRGNVAHSVLVGVMIFFEFSPRPECHQLGDFYIYKAFDFGIYIQSPSSTKIVDTTLVDCGTGIFGLTLEPGSLTHDANGKTFDIEDSVVIGQSESFSCESDVMDTGASNFRYSGQSRSIRIDGEGRVGVAFPVFVSGANMALRKSWMDATSYPTIGGLTTLTNVHFASFNTNPCDTSTRHFALTSNPSAHDASHPVEASGITWSDVEEESMVFFHRADLGQIDPSNCVDMECDGHKKMLLKDLDGSFFSSTAGSVVSESEFEWGGDARRGLGDYRIPRVMKTDEAGNLLSDISQVYSHLGIVRNDDCVYHDTWRAYECHDLEHEMLIIESMDHDTEDRRLSPVALRSHDDMYLDLINGPADHGWCDGYTCQKRVSTFYTLVALSKGFDIYFSSTNPQRLRLRLLNAESDEKVHLAVYYPTRMRLDAYLETTFVEGNEAGVVPSLTDAVGTNAYEPDTKLMHIILGGDTYMDIVITSAVVVSFSVPTMSVDEFFGANLVSNLATFLGIDESRIRVTVIVAEGSRRKRSDDTTVEVEISEEPIETLSEDDNEALSSARTTMQSVSNTIVTATQLGTIESDLGITINSVSVEEPLPDPSDSNWASIATMINDGDSIAQEIQVPAQMAVSQLASSGTESQDFDAIPLLEILDDAGERVTLLGSTATPWRLTASLVSSTGSDSDAILVGDVTVDFINGEASFDNLAISHSGSGYMIEFSVTYPAEVNFTVQMGPFTIRERELSGILDTEEDTKFAIDEEISFTLNFTSAETGHDAHDIFWKGHAWECTAAINNVVNYPGSLTGDLTTEVIEPLGDYSNVTFSGLTASHVGSIALSFSCETTPPSGYSFNVDTGVIHVTQTTEEMLEIAQRSRDIEIKFNADYNSVVSDQPEVFGAFVANYLVLNHDGALYSDFNVTEGSIVVAFTAEGDVSNIDGIINGLWQTVSSGLTLNYNGYTITAANYMVVNNENLHSDEEGREKDHEDDSLHMAIIVLICVLIILVIIAIIILVVFMLKKTGKRVERHTKIDVVNHVHVGSLHNMDYKGYNGAEDRKPFYLRAPSENSSSAKGSDTTSSGHSSPIEYAPMQAEKENGPLKDLYGRSTPVEQQKFSSFPPAGE